MKPLQSFGLAFLLFLGNQTFAQKKKGEPIVPPGSLTFVAESNLYKAKATFKEWQFTKLKFPAQGLEGLTGQIEVYTSSVSERTIRVSNDLKTPPYLDSKRYPKATGKITEVRALGGNRYTANIQIKIKKYKKDVTTEFEVLSENPYRIKGDIKLMKEDFQVGMGDEMGSIKSEVYVTYETDLRLD